VEINSKLGLTNNEIGKYTSLFGGGLSTSQMNRSLVDELFLTLHSILKCVKNFIPLAEDMKKVQNGGLTGLGIWTYLAGWK